MRFMKVAACILVLSVGPVMSAWANPTVSGVTAGQRAGTKLVDISYNLAATAPCTVSILVSSNSGAAWTVPATSLTGNGIGTGVSAGNGKQIVWNAGADWNGQWSTQMQVQVTATLEGGGAGGEMVFVQGGTLPDIGNGVITVSSFYIGKYEVTWGEWKTVRNQASARGYDIGSVGAGCADDHPVHSLNWYDVVKWCNLRSEVEGRTPVYTVIGSVYKAGTNDNVTASGTANGYRLPTDAEWEFAARGGIFSRGYEYSGGNDVNTVAWYYDNSGGATCSYYAGKGTWPVGRKASNELGLHDMSGNVWEWCFDWHPAYIGYSRVLRGGSWLSRADDCRSACRLSSGPDYRIYISGFRPVRTLP